MKLGIDVMCLAAWQAGDLRSIIDFVKLAEDKGLDQICVGDHVVMGEDVSAYPFGKFSTPLSYPWLEPITLLACLSGATERVRFATGTLLSPLRPAVLSRGRLDLGVSTGWQKAEYDASGLAFDGRFELMVDQVRACQTLWRSAPANYAGTHHRFENLHSMPQPYQKDLPLWFGLPPGKRNFDLIAELGSGWLPLGIGYDKIGAGRDALQRAFEAAGRDSANIPIGHIMMPSDPGPAGIGDIRASMRAQLPACRAAGVTHIRLFPSMYCKGPDEFEAFLDDALAALASGPMA
jgi:alkanesulfonate monooxygenase SsuD/methylene tetrahydromethanopterin reductase-like flavin-dependent oxidoreductase (luciferase family)